MLLWLCFIHADWQSTFVPWYCQRQCVGLDRYHTLAQYPIPDTIGRSYTYMDTDTDTGL